MAWINSASAASVAGLSGFTALAWLLRAGSLSGEQFVAAFAVLVLACLAIWQGRRLIEVNLKERKLIFAQLEKLTEKVDRLYGEVGHLRLERYSVDQEKGLELGDPQGIPATIGVIGYVAGCIVRERQRLAKVFVEPRTPEQIARGILDDSYNDRVFKWKGPAADLDVLPTPTERKGKRDFDQSGDA